MTLSHCRCDMRHISKLLEAIDKKRLAIEKGTIIRSQNSDSKACQLARFTEASAIETDLITSSPGHDKQCFVPWKNTKEEAVLNIQGILVEAAILPIIGGHQNKCDRIFQWIKIIAPANNKQFIKAVQAIQNICDFMARGGICAENKLMNHAMFNNDETIIPDQIIDGEGLLKECIEHGAHVYTEDNVVQSTNTIHPGTVKVGDIVDIGVSFRLQCLGQETKFQIHLDSITVINRQGAEILALLRNTTVRKTPSVRDCRPLKKRHLFLDNTTHVAKDATEGSRGVK
ncbi:hypothetical protein ARMGADRAFT_1028428 [Armillaria gallica]|uniref:Uncharacterized protein n=1 Tax=Armillaria gallica TaxID=47427 RepID=A0A2H3DLY5_ARMGA|nr:hypothetical protein ARMGADRAFT_1028428 [Armillaria gallica]